MKLAMSRTVLVKINKKCFVCLSVLLKLNVQQQVLIPKSKYEKLAAVVHFFKMPTHDLEQEQDSGGVLYISLGGEVRLGPSYPDPV